MKRAKWFFWALMILEAAGCAGELVRTLIDAGKHPAMYAPPYPTWQEQMRFSFIFTAVVIAVCAIALIILKIVERKRTENAAQSDASAAEGAE